MKEDTYQSDVYDEQIDDLEPRCFAGIYADIAIHFDVETALKMHRQFNGQQISFPVRLLDADYIKTKIIEEYANGVQIKDLSKKYNYSERRIRQILKMC